MAQLNALLWLMAPRTEQQVTWWSLLRMSAISLMLLGTTIALLARLAARGQTPGLTLVGLRWSDETGRAAWRRLLGEPQFWCTVLPTVRALLMLPPDTARFYIGYAPSLLAVVSTFDTLIGPALLLGALACMIFSRRHPGHLVSRG